MEILISINPCEECKCTHERHISYSFSLPEADLTNKQILEDHIRDFLNREGFNIKNPSNAKAVADKETLLEALQVIEARKLQERNTEEAVVKAP